MPRTADEIITSAQSYATNSMAGLGSFVTQLLQAISNISGISSEIQVPRITMPINLGNPIDPGARPQISEDIEKNKPSGKQPDSPTVQLPTWEVERPAQTGLTEPSYKLEYEETPYVSELLERAKTLLSGDIQNGGTGLHPDDEARLWEAMKDRSYVNMKAVIDEVLKQSAIFGWPIPQGAVLRALEEAEQKVINEASNANREISLKRADLYVANRQFAVGKSLEVEGLLINFHNAVRDRALNSTKFALDVGITLYDVKVKRYLAELEGYKTDGSIFESQVRGELAKVEVYKAQLEGWKTLWEAYVAELKSYVDKFDSEVKAYLADIEKSKNETELNTAILQGSYREQANAIQVNIEAAKVELQKLVNQLQLTVEGSKSGAEVFGRLVAAALSAMNASASVSYSEQVTITP